MKTKMGSNYIQITMFANFYSNKIKSYMKIRENNLTTSLGSFCCLLIFSGFGARCYSLTAKKTVAKLGRIQYINHIKRFFQCVHFDLLYLIFTS